jgi:hypothetical protein
MAGQAVTIIRASIDASGPVSILYRTLLASLPNSYRVVDAGADVALVEGADFATVERAVTGGARAVVVDQPGGLSLEEAMVVGALADHDDCLVVPAPRYAPRFVAAADLVDAENIDLVESTITAPHASRLELVEQLALVRQVLGQIATVRVLHASASHYVAEATMVDRPRSHVILNGMASADDVEEVTVRAIGVDQHLSVRTDAGPLARPAEISVLDGRGGHSPWPLHQHGHRITLGLLHRQLTTGEAHMTYLLEHLLEDAALAVALSG